MTKASKAALTVGLGCTLSAIAMQFILANWMHGMKPAGGPMGGMQVQFATMGYCIVSFLLAGLGSIGLAITRTRAANYAAYPFTHFLLAFILFLAG